MPGISDLFGKHGAVEQLFLWGLLAQVLGAEFDPFLTALRQDVSARHPLTALPADLAASAVARRLLDRAAGEADAGRGGIDAGRFATMVELTRPRLSPAELAEARLRSYLSAADAQTQADPQGYDPAMMATLTGLAGDAPGPDVMARALRRGLVPHHGAGLDVVSYDQGIAESRLHNKWGPLLFELTRVLLSPPDAASAVVRNFLASEQAIRLAEAQGVDAATFATMVHLSGDAPGPQQLAEALRRGLIPAAGAGPESTSFRQGIAEGRLADKWAPVIEGLAKLWPTPSDALTAQLKGQVSPAEGKALYERLGGDPQFMGWLLDSIGDSPTPLEAALMAARGVIPVHGIGPDVTSYDQAVRESRYKDKWAQVYRHLAEHIPAPSTVVTLLAHRQIDHAAAQQLLSQNDVRPDITAAYLGEAEYTAISDYRGLTESAVIDMYANHLIGRADAVPVLGALHVTEQAAELLLDYADMRYAIDSVNRSVQRIATLLAGRKIGVVAARDALLTLKIPPATVDEVITQLLAQAQASVKILTESQIVDAWYYTVFDPADLAHNQAIAQAELEAIGYTAYDAYVVLSVKAKGPLPNPPARLTAAPLPAVTPGVT